MLCSIAVQFGGIDLVKAAWLYFPWFFWSLLNHESVLGIWPLRLAQISFRPLHLRFSSFELFQLEFTYLAELAKYGLASQLKLRYLAKT